MEQVLVALKLHSDILMLPVTQPTSQSAISSGWKLGKHLPGKVIKAKSGLEERFWGLMMKEAHVSLDVSFFDQTMKLFIEK